MWAKKNGTEFILRGGVCEDLPPRVREERGVKRQKERKISLPLSYERLRFLGLRDRSGVSPVRKEKRKKGKGVGLVIGKKLLPTLSGFCGHKGKKKFGNRKA